MSYPYYCYPCCTPYCPPCCTVCYVPYLVCCNPRCPTTCTPASPPRKPQKLTNFSVGGPPDSNKQKNIKEKPKNVSKKVKGKEPKEKKVQGTKNPGKKTVNKTGGGGGPKNEKPKVVNTATEDNSNNNNNNNNNNNKTGGNPGKNVEPQDKPAIGKNNTGGNPKNPKNPGPTPVGDTKKTEVSKKKEKEVTNGNQGAGDTVPTRKVVCKCFAKQAPPCRCPPKPMLKSQPIPAPCICRGAGYNLPPFTKGNLPFNRITSTCTPRHNPNLQYPQTAPYPQAKAWPPGSAHIRPAQFPFAGDGLAGKIASRCMPRSQPMSTPGTLQNKQRISGIFSIPGDRSSAPKLTHRCVPRSEGPSSVRARQLGTPQICTGRGHNNLPFAGDGLPTRVPCKCGYRQQANPPVTPLQNKGGQRTTGTVPSTRSPVGYTRAICGTCGSIKFKPIVPVSAQPKKTQGCFLCGTFAVR